MKRIAQAIIDDPKAADLLRKVFLNSGGGRILPSHDPLIEAVKELMDYLETEHDIDIEVYT